MKQLQEGLKAGDLQDLVLPMLSIDEFSSKIDDNTTIVVAFYCFEEDAAHDLSNFVERSPVNVEDTEVSPAPSKEGYYLTFVEMRRSEQFPQRLNKLLDEVSRLTNVTNWQFTSEHLESGQVLEVTAQNIADHVTLKPKSEHKSDQIKEWLQMSSLSDVHMESNQLCLQRGAISWNMHVKQFDQVCEPPIMNYDLSHNSLALRLERLLEGGYQVLPTQDGLHILHPTDHRTLVVHVS